LTIFFHCLSLLPDEYRKIPHLPESSFDVIPSSDVIFSLGSSKSVVKINPHVLLIYSVNCISTGHSLIVNSYSAGQ
jgi:hypothetical protein